MNKSIVLVKLDQVKRRSGRRGAFVRYSIEGQDCTPQVNSLIVAGRVSRSDAGDLQAVTEGPGGRTVRRPPRSGS